MKNDKQRFEILKSLYAAAPLNAADFQELKLLAKKFNPKMAKYLEENPA